MFAFLRKLTRRSRLEREMRDELAFHLQARIDDLVRAGHSPAEARRLARIEFGGVDQYKEQLRDTRHLGWIEDFLRDLAYAVRNMRRAPLFALSAAGAIALGIGANTAVFSLIYGVLFRPLPVRDPGSIRIVYMTTRGEGSRSFHGSSYFVSFVEFAHMRAHAHTAELAGISEADVTAPVAPTSLPAQLVSDNLLTVLGAYPAVGRFFTRAEAASPGSAPVVVLAYDTWQKYFKGEDVAGRMIVLNRTAFTIAGVANRGFHGPLVLKADLWIPLTMQRITRAGESLVDDANAGFIQVFGRRRPGVNDRAMIAEMQFLGDQAVTAHEPLRSAFVSVAPGALFNYPEVMNHSVPVLGVLFAVVSLVLLVACANVANMLVARGFSRSREIAIRLSIGAGKGRIVRQLLTEHMLLGLLGGAGGLALAQLGVRALLTALPSVPSHQLNVSPDWGIAAWTFLIATAAGALFGLPAALGITRGGVSQSLRGGAFEARKHRGFRLQSALIGIQVAVSALLLINGGLLLRAAVHAIHVDPGQSVRQVLIVKPNLRDLQYTPAQAERYIRDLRDRAAVLPGVTSVSWTGFEPIISSCGGQAGPVLQNGSAQPMVQISCNQVGPGFFSTMGIRVRQSRTPDPLDRSAGKVAVVDEAFARLYLPGSPLGRTIRMGSTSEDDYEVVGVAASTRPLQLLQHAYPQVYVPLTGMRFLETRLVVAYQGPSGPLSRALRALSPQLEKETSLTVKPIEENVSTALSFLQLAAGGVATLGALALFLACTGVYGVVAFTVGRRRREIGVRIALGAPAASVMRLLIWQSIRPAWIGAVAGATLAAGAAQLLRTMLYGISPLDPAGFAGALLLLASVAALAAFLPASAALRVDPAITLRHD